MWISYSYDMGSISDCSEKFDLSVPSTCYENSYLSYEAIKDLLITHSAYINNSTVLSYYDQEVDSYIKLSPNQSIPVGDIEELDLLIKNSELSESSYLLNKIEDIKERINELEQQIGDHEEAEDKLTNDKEEIDIAVLYAAPLVKECKLKGLRSCEGYNVNISKEREKILDEFKTNGINAEIRFEVATLKNLSMVMSWKPRIVHISCHGFYLKNSTEFVLAFESSQRVGMTEEVSKNSLRRIFQLHPNFPGIFMISACYSEAIQDVLRESGIKYFVVVHKDCRIHDNAAIFFAAKFYKNLFLGKEISKSYEIAWKHLKDIGCDAKEVCCCVHKHSPNCALRNSKDIHKDHLPDETLCKCDKQEVLFRHRLSCQWAQNFLEVYHLRREPTDEEKKERHRIICCCPDYSVPHYDYAKFILGKNTEEQGFKLYSGYESRETKDLNRFQNLLRPEQTVGEVLGRGKDMYEILNKLLGKNRILMLHGTRDVGKTSVIKYVAQYGYDRNLFKNGVIYVDMKKRRFAKDAVLVIAEKLSCLDLHMESLAKILESLQVLVIIDNTDLMNEQEINELCNKVKYLHEYTKYAKFCIVRRNRIKIQLFDQYLLDKLASRVAAMIMKNLLGEVLYVNVRDFLRTMIPEIDKIPTNVLNYVNLLKTKSILEVKDIVKAEKKDKNLTENDELHNFVQNLNARSPETLKFLKFISKFPAGIYKSELSWICQKTNLNLENIFGVLKAKRNSILDLDSAIFTVPENLGNLLSDIEPPLFDYGLYLNDLSESIYHRCIREASNSDILKSLTGLFFNSNECVPSSARHFPDTPNSAFTVFEEMMPNFDEFIQFKNKASAAQDLDQNIFDICLYCSRVYVLKKNRNEADRLIKDTISYLKHLKRYNSVLIKNLKLFEYSVSYELYENDLDKLKNLESMLEKIKRYFDITQHSSQGSLGETYLLKALILIKKNNIEDVSRCFDLAKECFSGSGLEVEKARTLLAKVIWQIDQNLTDESILEDLIYAQSVFTRIGAERLKEETIFCMGRHFFQKEDWLECESYWNQGLVLANELSDRNLEIKYKEKLTQTYAQIRKNSKNVISILRSYPIVCTEQYRDMNNSVFCTHFSNFKDDLVNTLIDDNKIICLKFEIGTRANMIQQIEQGCRVLHISTVIPDKDKLVLENEDYSADVLTTAQLQSLLENKLEVHGVELVVLATPFSYSLAEFFHKTLKVPSVICFDFEQFPQIKYLTQLQKMFETAVEKFCISFYHNIIEGKVIREAWKLSKTITDSFIKQNSSLFEHLENYSTPKGPAYKGRGPHLFGLGNTALFTDSRQDFLALNNILQKGKLINMSTLKPPTNIARKANSFVGRHKTMHEIIKVLRKDSIVHIVGEQGIGKTKLVQHIGVYLNGRGLYTQGTFYESLKGSSSLDRFKELATASEEGVKKDMLLIIDDCEQLIRELTSSFLSFLEKIHRDCGVHIIISSLPLNFLYQCRQIELKPLDPLESAGLFMATVESNLKRKEICPYNERMDVARDLTQSNLIKDCMNNPAKIVKLVERLRESTFKDLEMERASHNPLMKKHSSDLDLPDFQYSASVMEKEEEKEEKEVVTKTPKMRSKGNQMVGKKGNENGKKKKNTIGK